MNTGYPAILTPQLNGPCSEIPITVDEESWIGRKFLFSQNRFKLSLEIGIVNTDNKNG